MTGHIQESNLTSVHYVTSHLHIVIILLAMKEPIREPNPISVHNVASHLHKVVISLDTKGHIQESTPTSVHIVTSHLQTVAISLYMKGNIQESNPDDKCTLYYELTNQTALLGANKTISWESDMMKIFQEGLACDYQWIPLGKHEQAIYADEKTCANAENVEIFAQHGCRSWEITCRRVSRICILQQ